MAEIQSLSIKHEAILDHLIANPNQKLGDVAKLFQVTPGWLSQIIHSDAFQRQLREKKDVVFHETVLPIRQKMHNIAHAALDRLADRIPNETETKELKSVAETMLDRIGFSPKVAPVQSNIHLTLVASQREALAKARERIGKVAELPVLEGQFNAISPNPADSLGSVQDETPVSDTAGEDAGAETGRAV